MDWPVLGPVVDVVRGRFVPPEPDVPAPVFDGPAESFVDMPPVDRGLKAYDAWEGDGPPPLGSEPALVLPLPGREADPERLSAAAGRLIDGGREARLGPYRLVTDVAPGALIEHLDVITSQVERVYAERYGLTPVGEAKETLVLFREESGYRAVQAEWGRIRDLASVAHTGYGMVVFYVGDLDPAVVGHTLLHELTHLLNRRSLGPALPPWLDEGIADDLAAARLDGEGRLHVADLSHGKIEYENRVELRGGLAGLDLLLVTQREGRAVPLGVLVRLEWGPFVGGPRSRLHYAESALLVRFLVRPTVRRQAFLGYLESVSRGESVAASTLEDRLGASWEEIEGAWRAFLLQQALESGLSSRLVGQPGQVTK
ncbi:MAG: hypothetical protein VYE73_13285 [Acidobacteriota bacterium]|nr:hypothetical protein [Acidobacteriota bacterium]